jgi:hypothetical protein
MLYMYADLKPNFFTSQIITFDNYGVSGHCNHRDVHYGVW